MGVMVVIFVFALLGLLLFAFCRRQELGPRIYSWILSNKEEKATLTRVKGHYNANESGEFQLSGTGSFRRFEQVDAELVEDEMLKGDKPVIPPQPLRPAPTPPPSPLNSSHDEITTAVLRSDNNSTILQRTTSCDSISSDSSVAAGDLTAPRIYGYLCIGIEFDSECGDLIVGVIEAKNLVSKEFYNEDNSLLDTYVCVYLLPEKSTIMQTRIYKCSNSPSFNEKFLFALEYCDFSKSSLMFHVYAAHRDANTLIGEARLMLCDVPTKQPITTWLTLADSNKNECNLGEILFSLSYLPTAERLTVVLVKARNLKLKFPTSEIFIKVYLLSNGKKAHKKKTSIKKGDVSPVYNEAMIFSVPNHSLLVRVTVAEILNDGEIFNIGHVIIGDSANGKALSHWSQMLTSLRKPVAMWHPLRMKTTDIL